MEMAHRCQRLFWPVPGGSEEAPAGSSSAERRSSHTLSSKTVRANGAQPWYSAFIRYLHACACRCIRSTAMRLSGFVWKMSGRCRVILRNPTHATRSPRMA